MKGDDVVLVTRRAVLKAGGAAATALALPAAAFARGRALKSHLRRSSYQPLVGHRFSVSGMRSKLRLLNIQDLNSLQAHSDNAFALVFHAPHAAPPLAQVPRLHHPALGSFDLFLTPGKSLPTGQHYVAVINRLHA
jgi:hypothetical protein